MGSPIGKKKPREFEVPGFEIELENSLKPVAPDPKFVDRLHRWLVDPTDVNIDPGGFSRDQATVVLVVVMLIALALTVLLAVLRLIMRPLRGQASGLTH